MTEPTPATPTAPNPAPETKPDSVPDQFWDSEKGSLKVDDFAKSFGELSNRVKIMDDLAASLPEEPDGYELTLPEDMELPEGFEFTTEGDERVEALQKWAHTNKIQPDAMKELLGIYAHDMIRAHQDMNTEMTALGNNAKGRIANLSVALQAHLPDEEASGLADVLSTASSVKAVEKLISGLGPAANPPTTAQQSPSTDEVMDIKDPFARAREIAAKGKVA